MMVVRPDSPATGWPDTGPGDRSPPCSTLPRNEDRDRDSSGLAATRVDKPTSPGGCTLHLHTPAPFHRLLAVTRTGTARLQRTKSLPQRGGEAGVSAGAKILGGTGGAELCGKGAPESPRGDEQRQRHRLRPLANLGPCSDTGTWPLPGRPLPAPVQVGSDRPPQQHWGRLHPSLLSEGTGCGGGRAARLGRALEHERPRELGVFSREEAEGRPRSLQSPDRRV